MRINEIIDKCALRLIILVAAYLILRHCGLSAFNHILCAVTVTLCMVALTEALLAGRKSRPSKETVSRTVAALALHGDGDFLKNLRTRTGGRAAERGFVGSENEYVSARLCGCVTACDIADCFREAVSLKCAFITLYAPYGADAAARELAGEAPLAIKLIGAEKLYETLAEYDMLPALAAKKKKKTLGEFAKVLLSKPNARKFLVAAAVILLFSVFVSFTVWYFIIAVIDVALAVVCLSGVSERIA